MSDAPLVGIVMGSESDRPTMQRCCEVLDSYGLSYEVVVRSAHRDPEGCRQWATQAEGRGLKVLIANLIAWPIAWYYLHNWLQGFAYRIPLSPVYFVGAGAAALMIAWATVFVHAKRVADASGELTGPGRPARFPAETTRG